MPISPQEAMGLVGWCVGMGFAGLVWWLVIIGGSGRKGK